MAWQTPKTDWTKENAVSIADLNRIEGNIAELKKAATIDIADTANNFAATNVEDALQELAGNLKNGKTTIANAITAMGQSATGTDTFDTLATKIRAISTDATAGTGDVLNGKTFYQGGAKKTGTMPNKVNSGTVLTPGASDIAIPQGYYGGALADGKVKGDPNLVPANIVNGISIFGVVGSFNGKRWATGTATTDSNGYITVNGLNFTPTYIIANELGVFIIYPGQASYTIRQNDAFNTSIDNTVSINAGSFSMKCLPGAGQPVSWIAIE